MLGLAKTAMPIVSSPISCLHFEMISALSLHADKQVVCLPLHSLNSVGSKTHHEQRSFFHNPGHLAHQLDYLHHWMVTNGLKLAEKLARKACSSPARKEREATLN
ncbi:hypothetical protein MHYP_G00277750 [Metynnis hypsauchen]